MNKFSIGADPEVFVQDGGKFISAHDLVPGTKQNPHPVKDGAVQVDGMALEFNINPSYSEEEFLANMESVSSQLASMIGDKKFLHTCSVFFEEADIKHVPTINLELGCMPDYNAYTLVENPPPNSKLLMRTAGGHLHLGGFDTDNEWSGEHYELSAKLARAMDRYVGIYSILWDSDDKRRTLYGKAGSFRPKTYGMEYRTLSNAWMFSKDIMSFVYRQSMKAVNGVVNGEDFSDISYQKIIDKSLRDNQFFKKDETAQYVMEMVHG